MIGVLNAPSYLGRQLALIQRTAPREIRGRVSSVFFVLRDTGFMGWDGIRRLGPTCWTCASSFSLTALGLLACGALALMLPGLGQRTG